MNKHWHGILYGFRSRYRVLNFFYQGINRVLGICEFSSIEKRNHHLKGAEFAKQVLYEKGVDIVYDREKLENALKNGPLTIISNHPHGFIDGLVMVHMLGDSAKGVVKLVANNELMQIESIRDNLLPVNAFENSRDLASKYRGARHLMKELDRDLSIIFFPAGDVSRFIFEKRKIEDPAWNRTFYKFIRLSNRPVLPIYIRGRNSIFYHFCTLIHPKLGIPLLFREFLKIKNRKIRVEIGGIVRYDTGVSEEILRELVYALREGQSSSAPMTPGSMQAKG